MLSRQMSETLKIPNVPISIIELGPGTGTMALDILRTLLSIRKSLKGINMGFIDVSEQLKVTQQQNLLKYLKSKEIYMNYREVSLGSSSIDNFTSETYEKQKFTMNWAKNLNQLMIYDMERILPKKQ